MSTKCTFAYNLFIIILFCYSTCFYKNHTFLNLFCIRSKNNDTKNESSTLFQLFVSNIQKWFQWTCNLLLQSILYFLIVILWLELFTNIPMTTYSFQILPNFESELTAWNCKLKESFHGNTWKNGHLPQMSWHTRSTPGIAASLL